MKLLPFCVLAIVTVVAAVWWGWVQGSAGTDYWSDSAVRCWARAAEGK